MARYSEERKQSVLRKMLPPVSMSIPELARLEGITETTLYNWRKQARVAGVPVPDSGKASEKWSAEAKFAVVVETATLSETELSAYCREKGLFPEQVAEWKAACIQGAATGDENRKVDQKQRAQDKKRIKALERDLNRKDRALAETTALLVLRKKFDALWGEGEED